LGPLSNRGKAFALVLLAPFLAELVSGSTAPEAWLLPWVLLVFMAIYGLSALAIRELAIRTGGGPVAVIVLGLAFGLVNEGMAAHSLFNPAWPDVGVLGSYGRFAGVNWIWTEWIVPFHAVWSIAFPIFLVGALWPNSRGERWISDRGVALCVLGAIATAVSTSLVFSEYPLSLVQWAGLFAAVAGLGGVAWRFSARLRDRLPFIGWVPTPRLAFVVGVLFFVVGQVGAWQTPKLGPYPEVGFGLLALAFLGVALFASGFDRSPEGERARFAFVLGGVGFYVALSPLSEFVLGRIGLVPIDAIVYLLLIRLYWSRARATSIAGGRSGPAAGPPPGAVGGV